MNRPKHGVWLQTLLFVGLLGSCASHAPEPISKMEMPEVWATDEPDPGVDCGRVGGHFSNSGTGYTSDDIGLVDGRLDAMLGVTMPSVRKPESIKLNFNLVSGNVEFTFVGPFTPSFELVGTCSQGWVVGQRELQNAYLGDGTNLDWSKRRIELSTSQEGFLLVHITLVARYSVLGIFKDNDEWEAWFRFDRVH
jgi:hypothetical protein